MEIEAKPLHFYPSATAFLRATFEQSKRGAPNLTIDKFADELGVGTSSLKMIFSGKRTPTVHLALSAARALKLSPAETSYLETLVLKDAARDEWERSYYSRNLKKLKRELRVVRVNTSQKELLADPLALPLLVYLLELKQKQSEVSTESSHKELAKKFDCHPDRIRDLLAVFERTGALETKSDGSIHVVFDKMNHRGLQKKYLKNLLDQAAKKIETDYDSPNSHFTGYTFTASNDALRRLKMELKSVMERYIAEATETDAEIQIAQACFQIFPVTSTRRETRARG